MHAAPGGAPHMSQTPLPPPLPPLPAEAYAPAPTPALPYTEFVRARRPGIITAIGVISIVAGSLGILASVYAGLALMAFSFTGNRAATGIGPGGLGIPPAVP